MLFHLFTRQPRWSLRNVNQITSLFGLKPFTHVFLPLLIFNTVSSKPFFVFVFFTKIKIGLTGWKKTTSQYYLIELRLKFRLDSITCFFFLLISNFCFSLTASIPLPTFYFWACQTLFYIWKFVFTAHFHWNTLPSALCSVGTFFFKDQTQHLLQKVIADHLISCEFFQLFSVSLLSFWLS